MKKIDIFLYTLTIIGFIAVFILLYPTKYKPKYKEGNYFEYWDEGNEFTPKKLIQLGDIKKVGKEVYLLEYFYCGSANELLITTVSLEYFDKYYKNVGTIEQLTKDAVENCTK